MDGARAAVLGARESRARFVFNLAGSPMQYTFACKLADQWIDVDRGTFAHARCNILHALPCVTVVTENVCAAQVGAANFG